MPKVNSKRAAVVAGTAALLTAATGTSAQGLRGSVEQATEKEVVVASVYLSGESKTPTNIEDAHGTAEKVIAVSAPFSLSGGNETEKKRSIGETFDTAERFLQSKKSSKKEKKKKPVKEPKKPAKEPKK